MRLRFASRRQFVYTRTSTQTHPLSRFHAADYLIFNLRTPDRDRDRRTDAPWLRVCRSPLASFAPIQLNSKSRDNTRARDRVYASTFDDDGDGADDDVDDDDGGGGEKKTLRAQPLIFRDVLLRSRALESLATSYAMRAPADAVETSLLTEVFASLCAGGERVAAALARGVIEARPVACAGPPATAFAPRAPFLEDMPFLTFLPARASFLDSIPTHRDASRLHLTRPELRRPDATSLRAGKPPADFSRDVEARGDGAAEVRSIHWSPYDHVGVVNAVP